MGDEIPGPFDRIRDRLNQANGQWGKDQTHLWKPDLALTTCPQCGIEIKYTSSEKWRGTLKCHDCGVSARALIILFRCYLSLPSV